MVPTSPKASAAARPMAPRRRNPPRLPAAGPRKGNGAPVPAPAHQESDVDLRRRPPMAPRRRNLPPLRLLRWGLHTKRQGFPPPPPRYAHGSQASSGEDEESESHQAPKRKAAAAGLAVPSPSKKNKAPAAAGLAQLAKLPAAAGAFSAGAAAEAANAPAGAEDGQAQELSPEKRFQERINAYRSLWDEIQALGAEQQLSDLVLKNAFLKLPDAVAMVLNTKLKQQQKAEMELFTKRCDINMDVSL